MRIGVSLALLIFLEIGVHARAGREPRFSTTVFGTSIVIPAGLTGLVYELNPATQKLPDFGTLRPVSIIYTAELNIPPQNFMQGLLIDNDGIHPPALKKASLKLNLGVHGIRVSYFQGPRFDVALTLRIAGPSLNWRLFNTDELTPPSDAGVWRPPTAEVVPNH